MAKFAARCRLFNVRLAHTRSLWTPETTFRRETLKTPQYKVTVMVKKTGADWSKEPEFAPILDACRQVHAAEMAHINPASLKWPIRDGDALNDEGKPNEWSKGYWTIILSSNSQPEVGCFVDGVPLPLPTPDVNGRRLWEDGDRAIVDISVTKNANNPVAFKLYVNSVAFNAKDEPIKVGVPRASLAEMAADAQARGISVTGIHGMAGMAGAAPFTPGAPPAFAPQPAPSFAATSIAQVNGPAFAPPTLTAFAPPPAIAAFAPPPPVAAPFGAQPYTPAAPKAKEPPLAPLYKTANGQIVDSRGRPTSADGRHLLDDDITF